MCAPLESQLLPLGSCGSSFCQAVLYSAWLSQLTSSTGSWKEPPQATPTPSGRTAHSATLPRVSKRPQALGFILPTSWVLSSPLTSYQAYSLRVLLSTLPSPPALQA